MSAPFEKLCWFCKHFHYMQGDRGYSDMTPGNDFSMTCTKGHWDFNQFETTQEQFAEMLSRAKTCVDFVLLDAIREKLERERKP